MHDDEFVDAIELGNDSKFFKYTYKLNIKRKENLLQSLILCPMTNHLPWTLCLKGFFLKFDI